MNACRDHELSLSLRAAGALDPAEAERLEAHLAGCAACRAEAALVEDTLRLAKLPPVSDLERRALAGLPERALVAVRRTDAARRSRTRTFAGLAVAAAIALALLSPAVLRRTPDVPGAPDARGTPNAPAEVATAAATWEAPDLDTVWADASVLDLSESEDDYGMDAALDALVATALE